jgi:ribosomal protein S17
MRIEKKVWPEYFKKIVSGEKKYELRLDDFECHEGDKLILKEYNPETKKYTGREVVKKNYLYIKN